jgi:steroid Delta-isomerase
VRDYCSGAYKVDLVESMDIENGLIVYHRVYWGWMGFRTLLASGSKKA